MKETSKCLWREKERRYSTLTEYNTNLPFTNKQLISYNVLCVCNISETVSTECI